MKSDKEFELKRKQLVEFMKGSQAIESIEVEKAFSKVKRENFMPANMIQFSYADDAMPLGFNQTISQPSTIAIMLELLEPGEGMKILEVGAGSGYVCALLSEIVGANGKVFGVELVKELTEIAKENLKKQKVKNVKIVQADGSDGYLKEAPYDRILVSAACPFVPKPLFDQLKEKGLIVAPVGDRFSQQLIQLRKFQGKPMKKEYLKSLFMFVPLRGKKVSFE